MTALHVTDDKQLLIHDKSTVTDCPHDASNRHAYRTVRRDRSHAGARALRRATLAPAWDVGRPQRAIYNLEIAGEVGHAVLDVGCGIGAHTFFFRSRSHLAWGVDPSPHLIDRAQRRAKKEHLPITFCVENLLRLERLAQKFDCAVDAGSFHGIDVAARQAYAASLHATLVPGGNLYLLCVGEHERGRGGPVRVRKDELRAVFANGWRVDGIEASLLESRIYPGGANAWLLRATRVSSGGFTTSGGRGPPSHRGHRLSPPTPSRLRSRAKNREGAYRHCCSGRSARIALPWR